VTGSEPINNVVPRLREAEVDNLDLDASRKTRIRHPLGIRATGIVMVGQDVKAFDTRSRQLLGVCVFLAPTVRPADARAGKDAEGFECMNLLRTFYPKGVRADL
jgi:hypothetical protein